MHSERFLQCLTAHIFDLHFPEITPQMDVNGGEWGLIRHIPGIDCVELRRPIIISQQSQERF